MLRFQYQTIRTLLFVFVQTPILVDVWLGLNNFCVFSAAPLEDDNIINWLCKMETLESFVLITSGTAVIRLCDYNQLL